MTFYFESELSSISKIKILLPVLCSSAHGTVVWVFNLNFSLVFISVMCIELGSLWALVIVEE